MEGHSSHGYQSVAQQPGYQQGPASFSSADSEGYQYYNSGSAYQAQPPTHRYQGGGLLQAQFNGQRSPVYGHGAGYGATASVSMVCLGG